MKYGTDILITHFKIRYRSNVTCRLKLRVICIVNIYLFIWFRIKRIVLSSTSFPLYFQVNTLVMISNARKDLNNLTKITWIFPDMFEHVSISAF